MKVQVTTECIGCGLCETMCPQVFQLDADGQSHAISSDDAFCDLALQTSAACPVNAISVQ